MYIPICRYIYIVNEFCRVVWVRHHGSYSCPPTLCCTPHPPCNGGGGLLFTKQYFCMLSSCLTLHSLICLIFPLGTPQLPDFPPRDHLPSSRGLFPSLSLGRLGDPIPGSRGPPVGTQPPTTKMPSMRRLNAPSMPPPPTPGAGLLFWWWPLQAALHRSGVSRCQFPKIHQKGPFSRGAFGVA
jgi:hypothetical protein